jgi:hypothetical protein
MIHTYRLFLFLINVLNRLFWFFEHAGIAHTPFSVSDATLYLQLKSKYTERYTTLWKEVSIHSFSPCLQPPSISVLLIYKTVYSFDQHQEEIPYLDYFRNLGSSNSNYDTMEKKIQAILKTESNIGVNKIDENTLTSISPEISVYEKNIVYPIQEISTKCISLPKLSLKYISNMLYLDEGTRGIIHIGKLWGSLVVIKSSTSNSNTASNELENERAILERLSHKNIVQILGLGTIPRQFIILEFVDGETLDEFILKKYCSQSSIWLRKLLHLPKRKYTLTMNDTASISRQILSALDYLHDKFHPDVKIIHRGILESKISCVSI